MQNIENLVRTKEYWVEKIQDDLCININCYIEEAMITQTQFAEKMGVTKGYISQVLNGKNNHSLEKMIGLALSVGVVPDIKFKPIDDYIYEQNLEIAKSEQRNRRNRVQDDDPGHM